eukprot:CAMPEP_0194030544 /NCGR_PEP_ID=MMETSP0009_2-20130614/3986_1 /TAXON_ID=210454 /ORGANISM="Grammatophora oceanica, Strain CCMP 410" /LENGTH=630 /DNA_ID=CAMNT_0038670507 /DNA_START=307 /DNA_END=2199 /DNA_ORIENTATION=-
MPSSEPATPSSKQRSVASMKRAMSPRRASKPTSPVPRTPKSTPKSAISGAKLRASDDDIRDGKFFHVRLTLDALKGVKLLQSGRDSPKSLLRTKSSDDASFAPDVVCFYAALVDEIGKGKDTRYIPSKPLSLGEADPKIVWPQPDETNEPANTSKRRLYHSILLRAPDHSDGTVDSTSTGSGPDFAPGVINIQLGLMKNNSEKIPVGIASLVIAGQDVDEEEISLVIRPLKKVPSSPIKKVQTMVKQQVKQQKQRSFGGFLGKKKKTKKTSPAPNPSPPPPPPPASPTKTRPSDPSNKTYRLMPGSALTLRVDVMGGMFEGTGPGLWGDLLDDEESFGPIPVVDLPDSRAGGDLSNRYLHETVEVLNSGLGTTIISSPGSQFSEDRTDEDNNSQITPSIYSSNLDESYTHRDTIRTRSDTSDLGRGATTSGIADYFALCGDTSTAHDEYDYAADSRYIPKQLDNTFSFATTLPDDDLDDENLDDFNSKPAIALSLPPTLRSASTDMHNTRELESLSKPTTYNETETDLGTDTLGQSTIDQSTVEDLSTIEGTYDSTDKESRTDGGSHTSEARTEVLSVGEATLESVHRARTTLQRYATRLGVNVEDLLEAGTESVGSEYQGTVSTSGSRM